jgi:large subunit ribosomal protein L5
MAAEQTAEAPPTPRLQQRYQDEIAPQLFERFGYSNRIATPRLKKVVISMGMGETAREPARLEEATKHLTLVSGQKPVVTRARKSVSNFKLREGMPVGLKVTLRRQRMYEFFDRLVSLALPRVRDFRGLDPNGFDGRGNYNMGLQEQTIFPEIDPDSVSALQGMNLCFQTTAETDEEARELLTLLGMPFRRD